SETSVLALGEAIAGAVGAKFDPEFAEPRLGEIRRSSIDPARATSVFGWRPVGMIGDGIERTIAAISE
ncbi:MAG: UDP-glucose 4-epimerase, partial [Solirubrobacterales bacterium]